MLKYLLSIILITSASASYCQQSSKVDSLSVAYINDSIKHPDFIQFYKLVNDSTIELHNGFMVIACRGFGDSWTSDVTERNRDAIKEALLLCRKKDVIGLSNVQYKRKGKTDLIKFPDKSIHL